MENLFLLSLSLLLYLANALTVFYMVRDKLSIIIIVGQLTPIFKEFFVINFVCVQSYTMRKNFNELCEKKLDCDSRLTFHQISLSFKVNERG